MNNYQASIKLSELIERSRGGDATAMERLKSFLDYVGDKCGVEIPASWSDQETIECAEWVQKLFVDRASKAN